MAARHDGDEAIEVGALVWGNYFGTTGLPYRAEVIDVRGDRVKIHPSEGTLTQGSVGAASRRPRDPLSRRVRWVKSSSVRRMSQHEIQTGTGIAP